MSRIDVGITIFLLLMSTLSSAFSLHQASPEVTVEGGVLDDTVVLVTTMGNITIRLFEDMPITTGNFRNLTQFGAYDGTLFYRVVPDFIIEGGDASAKGIIVPMIPDELPNKHSNVRGSVAMGKTIQPNSARSIFFINLNDSNAGILDSSYSVFGTVVAGMDVVDKISQVTISPPNDGKPIQDITIIKAQLSGPQNQDWWPMCQHDLQHTGYSSSKIPDNLVSVWNSSCLGDYCQPVVFDGVLYVGSGGAYPGLSAINETDGTLMWNHPVGAQGITTSPAVCEEGIFVGSWEGQFYRFDFEGNVLWNFTTEIDRFGGYGHAPVWSSPIVDAGKVYFLTYAGHFYALNLTNGETVWSYQNPALMLDQASPTAWNGAVYFGSIGGGLRGLNETDGSSIMYYGIGPATAAPTISDGRVYIGSTDDNFYCLNATNGALIWKFTANGPIYYSSAMFEGNIYFSDYQGYGGTTSRLYALNMDDGSLIWNIAIDPRVRTDTIIADGKIFVGSPGSTNYVFAFNVSDGSSIWSYETPYVWFGGSFALADRKLFVGFDKLCVFGELATISPTSVVMDVGQSQLFTSSVAGGSSPYSYQWFLDDVPVSGATIENWTYAPSTAGLNTVYVNVTDSGGVWTTSNIANVTVNIHDLAVTNVTSCKTMVCQGLSASISVTVADLGNYTETFNVTTCVNATVIGIQTVNNISGGMSEALCFSWNASGFAKGNYALKASADPVLGETNTTNNNFTGGWVFVSMLGDLTGPTPGVPDGKCDIRDIAYVAKAFGSTPGTVGWNPNCDLTGPTSGVPDDKVDIMDIAIVAKHFGEVDP